MINTILQTDHLLIGHDKKPLSEPINLSLQQGDCLAVLGRNGSGKSTLLHTLCKFIPAISGDILIEGKNIRHLNYRELAVHVSVVFSGRREVIGQIQVEEVLKLGRFPYTGFYAKLSKEDKYIIEEVVTALGIGHLLKKNISHISDGEAQKVFIARALIQDTDIMIFDEPTTHLDLFNKHEIFNIIRELSGRQKTILISTHEVSQALAIANQCVLFADNGRIIYGLTTTLEKEQVIESYFGDVMVK